MPGITKNAVLAIAQEVRSAIVLKYPQGLHGACIEASDLIVAKLRAIGVEAANVEGWCLYDDEYYGSDRPYDEHTWVQASIGEESIFIDVTLDQFQGGMDDFIAPIVIGEVPTFLVLDEPKHLLDESQEEIQQDIARTARMRM